MTKQQKLFASAGGIALLIVLAVIWFVRAPYSTLESIKVAAERRDLPELNRLIDFPSVKSSLKLLLMDSIKGKTGEPSGLGTGLARLFAGALAAPVVESMVTPESISAMFSGTFSFKGRVGSSAPPALPDAEPRPDKSDQKVTVTHDWDGLSAVRVNLRVNAVADQGVTFVMRRDGLSWRLSGIER